MITICIPDTPPSNNEYLGKNKRFQYATAKQHWEKMVYAYGRNLKPDHSNNFFCHFIVKQLCIG